MRSFRVNSNIFQYYIKGSVLNLPYKGDKALNFSSLELPADDDSESESLMIDDEDLPLVAEFFKKYNQTINGILSYLKICLAKSPAQQEKILSLKALQPANQLINKIFMVAPSDLTLAIITSANDLTLKNFHGRFREIFLKLDMKEMIEFFYQQCPQLNESKLAKQVCDIFPFLDSINLSGQTITGKKIPNCSSSSVYSLAKLKGLKHLNLSMTPIGDFAIDELAIHGKLHSLNISSINLRNDLFIKHFTDEFIAPTHWSSYHLKNNKYLREINITNNNFPEKYLCQLLENSQLTNIAISGNDITKKVRKLIVSSKSRCQFDLDISCLSELNEAQLEKTKSRTTVIATEINHSAPINSAKLFKPTRKVKSQEHKKQRCKVTCI